MIFESSFYLADYPAAKLVMAFVETMKGHIDRMTVTDTSLRSRSGRLDMEKISKALARGSETSQIILFEQGKDGNNNHPERYVQVVRLPSVDDDDRTCSLIALAPAQYEDELAPQWFKLAAGAKIDAGAGIIQQPPNSEINYGQFVGSRPQNPGPVWRAFDQACVRYLTDPASFKPVIEGKMLRNVLRYNFMTTTLAHTIRSELEGSGLPVSGFTDYPNDRVVWFIPDAKVQQAAHAILHKAGLIWEPVWFDLEAYVPGK